MMIFRLLLCLTLIFSCTGCDAPISKLEERKEKICGREGNINIYRAKIPSKWLRKNAENISNDTTIPLCEYIIEDANGQIRITIHNFPTNSIEERVPPIAQITRWKRQFENLNPSALSINSESHGGFSGLYFQGEGIQNGKPTMVLGWSMQIAPEHYRMLSYPTSQDQSVLYRQMRADYTIKAVGSPEAMEIHKKSIVSFAKSFELIQEIPTRS